jgi:hypothetical protein
MSNGLERRLSRLEHVVAERTKPRICNCRAETQYHNADCLDGLLKRMPRVCPIHSFRDLGFFLWMPLRFPLLSEDNQYCTCPPDLWRSFILSGVPRTREAHYDALEASRKLWGNPLNLEEDNKRAHAMEEKYWETRQQFVDKTGRQLPGRRELIELKLRRLRELIDEGGSPIL